MSEYTVLALDERSRLQELEALIEKGIQTFVDVGNALLEIRDKRLYRAEYPSFEAYCTQRWGFQRAHAYRLMGAAQIARNVDPIGDSAVRESHVRPLRGLNEEEQRLVWEVVKGTAPDGKITAGHVKSVVEVLKEVTQTRALDPGDGVQIDVSDAMKYAITEETYERMMRMKNHISEHTRRKLVYSDTIYIGGGVAYFPLEDGKYTVKIYKESE